MIKLQCRWCRRNFSNIGLRLHEVACLYAAQCKADQRLGEMAKSYNENQLAWSIEQAKRWRSLPGKGWQFLDMVPMVEYIGKVTKEIKNG